MVALPMMAGEVSLRGLLLSLGDLVFAGLLVIFLLRPRVAA